MQDKPGDHISAQCTKPIGMHLFLARCVRSFIFVAGLVFVGVTMADPPPPLFCDREVYPPLQLTWSQSTDFKQVVGVFPHPLMTLRVVVATRTGLSLSDDAGRTWKALPEASVEKVGVINKVEFHIANVDTFYLASQTKGLWVTTDAGKSFRQIGTKAAGMAVDKVEDVIINPIDAFHRTLLVVHGGAGEGISRSRDAGKTWDIVSPGYFFRRILIRERESKEVYVIGSLKESPDIQNFYICNVLGEMPLEIMHDAIFTDMAFSLSRKNNVYVSTSDGGLHSIESSQFTPEVKQLGSKDDNWGSVAPIWGPNADVLNLCLYNPTKLGLVLANENFTASHPYGGLPVGSIVKEGACVRPNANGTIFYAAINASLLIGRPSEAVPVVNITPAACRPVKDVNPGIEDFRAGIQEFTRATSSSAIVARKVAPKFSDAAALYRQNQMTITALLPVKPAPPVSVTVDLSRFGGSSSTPLYDDGLHNDGAAGDGLYGVSFFFQPTKYQYNGEDWRPYWPGRMVAGVTATYADGSRQGAVGVTGIYPEIRSLVYWGIYHDQLGYKLDGDVTADLVKNPPELHKGPTTALRLHIGHGAWSMIMDANPYEGDMTGYQSFSFGVRTEGDTSPKEIYLQLQDTPDLSEAITTDRVGVLHDVLHESGFKSDYRTVAVPVTQLLGKQIAQFQTTKLTKIIFSGDAGEPATLVIDWPCFLPPTDESSSADKTSSK